MAVGQTHPEASTRVDPPPSEVEISVVLPCLNEAEGVARCIRKARRAIEELGVVGEVVVVDNGSTDGSPEIAEAEGARVVHESRKGYGSAYLTGFDAARGRYIVMGDADDTYDFSKLASFVAPLRDEGVELVMGTRLKGEILPGAMSWSHRWIGNPILSTMLRLLFRTRISDSHCGMRGFTREALQKMDLHTTGMEFASEMVVASLREGLKIKEIPITYHPRIGDSKLEGVRDAWRHVRFMLLFSPSYLFLLPGVLLLLLGIGLVVPLLGGPRELFGRVWDYHVMFAGTLLVIVGYSIVIFDVCAKKFSMLAGFARRRQWLQRLDRLFNLERGLLLGTALLVVGVGIVGKVVAEWIRSGYGELMAVREGILAMTLIVLGIQTVLGSFLVSLFEIKRR